MGQILSIVQGNNFGTAIRIHAVDAKGHEIQDFSLEGSTDIRVWYLFAGKETDVEAWTMEDGKILIVWPKDITLGSYDIFIEGVFEATAWRNAMKSQFRIVKYNYEAYIPDDVIVLNGIYQLSAEMAILTRISGGGGIPSQTIPLMDGEASVGEENAYARGDHRHPSDTRKQDVIADLATIRSGAAAGATAYQKPSAGIPKSDLASGVQTSLGKADTALQATDIIDSLSSTSTTSALSANQGKVLNDGKQDKIDASHKLSADLVDDTSTTNKFVTAAEKTTWNNKSDFSGSYNDLTNKPTIPTALSQLTEDTTHRVVTDAEKTTWNGKESTSNKVTSLSSSSTDTQYPSAKCVYDGLGGKQDTIDSAHKLDYSLLDNTPTIPAAQVNSDWNANSGVAQILNKPTIPTALSQLTEDTTHRVVTDTEKAAWNGKANKVLVNNHGTSDTTYSVTPNVLHIWGTVGSLTLTLATPTDNTIVNEYMIEFVSGSTATTLSLPSSVEWGNRDPLTGQTEPLVVAANATYQISIVNNIGLWTAISNS